MTENKIDAIQLDPRDNVATVLRKVPAKDDIVVKGPDGMSLLAAAEDISLCHKVALQSMQKGEQVVKYGQSIGTIHTDVGRGSLVHVHNMSSNRGQRSSCMR